MANVAHASLTGSSLHEPKGIENASSGEVYVANGAGSGEWDDINNLVTVTNFTTGDVKMTFKTTADTGWIMMDDGSIGDALSGATTRANADCEDLFLLIWNNISNSWASVSGGRGASAAADWAAHKYIVLPKALGHAMGLAGSGSGLTARTLGSEVGTERHTITLEEMYPHTHSVAGTTGVESANHQHTFSGTTGVESVAHSHSYNVPAAAGGVNGGGDFAAWVANYSQSSTGTESTLHTHNFSGGTNSQTANHTHSFSVTSGSAGAGNSHNNMQPTIFLNAMIKL